MAGGRPEITIDWRKVDQLLMAGYNGLEVSAELGIHHDTLYNRTLTDLGISFSDYSAQKHSKGDGLLKAKQFNKAME